MAKAKAKTVTVRIAVVYSGKGDYQAGGYGKADPNYPLDDGDLIEDAHDAAPGTKGAYPHACIVNVELPVPKPPEGKVTKVKVVKL